MLVLALRRLPSAIVTIVLLPIIAREYFRRETGAAYGIALPVKLTLLCVMVRNNLRIESASNFITHLLMAAKVMNVPKEVPGALAEFGCFKGGSTANLSLIAAATGRELHVFDSFAGLPAPLGDDGEHVVLADQEVRTYREGAYAGTLTEVTEHVSRFGNIGVCTFHEGWFEDTLPAFEAPLVFVYLDVDLAKSEETCLRHVWPLLADGSSLFTDEAHQIEIAGLFYDSRWWEHELATSAPGLVGGGSGLGLYLQEGGFGSSLGYTTKVDASSLARRPG